MATRERIYCDCGGELQRPLPKSCPHCGGQIVAVRRRWWTLVVPVLVVAALFGGVAVFAWLVGRPH